MMLDQRGERENARVMDLYVKGDFNKFDAKGRTPQELSRSGDIDLAISSQLKKAKSEGKTGVIFENLDDSVGLYDRPATHSGCI